MGKSTPRLPFAECVSIDPISTDDARWTTVAAAYGHELSVDLRGRIGVATVRFAERKDVEQNAEPMAAAIKRADRLRECLEALCNSIRHGQGSDAAFHCDQAIEKEYRRITKAPDASVPWGLIDVMSMAVEHARRKLLHSDGLPIGTAFAHWIIALIEILESVGLPVTISKGIRPDGTDSKSPFVHLVHALQMEFLGKDLRQHMQSIPALAKAMDAARRQCHSVAQD